VAYERTDVAVQKSQDGIRKLIMGRKGNKLAFISEPPREGFAAVVLLEGVPYQVRISAECREPRPGLNQAQQRNFREQEERRIWRVLFHHLKAISEAAESGVLDFREMMLPYIVTKDGRTIAERIVPHLDQAIEANPARLLT
jgi:hypothetical protein